MLFIASNGNTLVHSWYTGGEPELISVLHTAQFEHTASNVMCFFTVQLSLIPSSMQAFRGRLLAIVFRFSE